MKIYRIKECFGLVYEHATIFFTANSRWKDLGEHNGHIRPNRENVFADVTREQIRNFMVEVKEQACIYQVNKSYGLKE